jgi:hypothetical protein
MSGFEALEVPLFCSNQSAFLRARNGHCKHHGHEVFFAAPQASMTALSAGNSSLVTL